MRKRLLMGVAAMMAAAFAMLGLAISASAAPAGGLSLGNQVCQPNGTVDATLSWHPSGTGSQWVDLALDPQFNSRSTGGPYPSNQGSVTFTQMKPNTMYYARVWTYTNQWHSSPSLAFTTQACTPVPPGTISAPFNLQASNVTQTSARISWTPGTNNIWFCVDTAPSLQSLFGLGSGWRNHGCWNTTSVQQVTGLACGTTYYYLVYAWNQSANVKSDARSFTTLPCSPAISAPYNLFVSNVTQNSATVHWTPGLANIWFCVDTAPTQQALLGLGSGWRNHGCWTTANQLTIHGLTCGTTYHYLVYTWNHTSNAKSSSTTFTTAACSKVLEQAPIESVDVVKVGSNYRVLITAGLPNSCHSPHDYHVERVGRNIYITVWNEVVQADVCAFVYGTYDLNINLGSDFTSGRTYTVTVNNDKSDSFVAD